MSIIVDLYGLPGSGKTTVSEEIVQEFKKNGYTVSKELLKVNNTYNSLRRVYIKLTSTIIFSVRHYSFMYELFKNLNDGTLKNRKTALKQWVNICYVLDRLNRNYKEDIIVADQGLAQAAISLVADAGEEQLVDIIEKLDIKTRYPIIWVYVKNDLDQNIQRLRVRSNGKSRVEAIESDMDRMQYLKNIQKKIDIVSKYFCDIIIDNAKSVSPNSKILSDVTTFKILEAIEKIFMNDK